MPKITDLSYDSGIKNEARVIQLLERNEKYKGKITSTFMGGKSIEGDKAEIIAYLKSADEALKALEEAERAEQAQFEAERAAGSAQVLITSGYSFEGYKITKYSGYISGDDAIEIDRGGIFGKDNGARLTNALVIIRRQALKELKEAAYDLGCNAVIGVDFDYITLEPETISGGTHYYEPYVICVTANGNAVMIEKE